MSTVTPITQQEPYIRLLVCHTCKSIEELPPYEGPNEHDVLLNVSVEKHGDSHMGRLFNVSALHWHSETLRPMIIEQIRKGSPGLDVFGTQFYNTRMTFHEDAMACYKQHNRPKEGCPEFRVEKKRLVPGTNKERKEIGLSPVEKGTGPKVFVCDFCPVRSYYAHKHNVATGIG
jgi:hypothetical protein